MKTLRDERGFALVFVLILAVISLMMTVAMLFMVSRGSYVSAQQRRFRTAVEAGRGGMEATFQVISGRGTAAFDNSVNLSVNSSMANKLAGPTGTSTWTGLDNTMTIDPSVATTYDMRIDLGTYRVFTKIVDTVDGNSGADEGLLKTGVVNAGSGEVTVVSVPYLYTIEVLSQSQSNPAERSRLSVLYQY